MALHLRPVDEQVIVVTGASSGIGLVTARMAARRGARLVLAARNEDALRRLADEIEAAGGRAVYVVADVGREEDVARIAVTALQEFGRFDTWINNAGVSIVGAVEDVSTEDMHRLFDTVLWGAVYGSLQAVRHFRSGAGGGALINVGSVFGDRSTPLQSVYASAKYAVRGFTEGLRVELEAEKAPVSVTLIHPGRIDTPYNEHAQSYVDRQPAHRGMIYPPEAVAESILYAAAHPKRDVYVGAQAKLLARASDLAPRSIDRIMRRYMYYTQLSNRPSRPRTGSALHQAGYGLHERGTHEGFVRARSYSVLAATHPKTAAALGAAALTASALALIRLSGRRSRPA